MTNFRGLMLTSLLGSVALIGGCSVLAGTNCQKPPGAADAQSQPPLRVPAGLDGPDTREAMVIPDLDEKAVPAFATRCLEDPPLLAPLPVPVDAKADKEDEDIDKELAKRRARGTKGPHFR